MWLKCCPQWALMHFHFRRRVKAHYTKSKLAIQNSLLESKFSDFLKEIFKWCWSSHFFPFPSSYHHNLNLFLKPFKRWALKKIKLDIKMNFTNWNLKIWIFKILRNFFLLEFFILSVMALQCVVIKSYRLSFQLHYKKKSIMIVFLK
jgi:hypothetical protein